MKQVQSKGRELEETWQQRETSNANTTGGGTTPLCKALSLVNPFLLFFSILALMLTYTSWPAQDLPLPLLTIHNSLAWSTTPVPLPFHTLQSRHFPLLPNCTLRLLRLTSGPSRQKLESVVMKWFYR